MVIGLSIVDKKYVEKYFIYFWNMGFFEKHLLMITKWLQRELNKFDV